MRPTIAQLKATGVTGVQVLIFYGILQMIDENEDGRTAAAGRYLGEQFGCSERTIRQAQAQLEKSGWFRSSTKARRYTMISRGWRLTSDAQNDAENEAPKKPKKQYVSHRSDVESGVPNDATGVTAVRRSSGVDVDAVGLTKELGKPRATLPIVHKSKSPATARYEAAIERAPALLDVTMHIDRIYADLSSGHKYPWAGNPDASTILADLIFSHGAPLVIAATERFFIRGNAWIEERAWAINEFARQFARLIAHDGATKRAAQVVVELKNQARPSTPNELRAQFVEARRRQVDAIHNQAKVVAGV